MIICFLCNTHAASANISICCRFWHCTQHTHDILISLHTVHFAKCHDDAIKLKHFPRYSPFMRGISCHRWIHPVTGGFPSQMPVTRSFDVINYLRLNKRLNKRSRHRWFETQTRSLWRHCNDTRNNWNGIEINYENCVRPYLLTCNEILGYVIAMNMTYKHIPIYPFWWILKTSWFVLNGKVVQVNDYDK